jgi:hypothetical protein
MLDGKLHVYIERANLAPVSPLRLLDWSTAMGKLRIRDVCFGREIAHATVSRRPPIPLDTMVPRNEGFTYAAKAWDLSIVQGPFSRAPCQNLTLRFAILHRDGGG